MGVGWQKLPLNPWSLWKEIYSLKAPPRLDQMKGRLLGVQGCAVTW